MVRALLGLLVLGAMAVSQEPSPPVPGSERTKPADAQQQPVAQRDGRRLFYELPMDTLQRALQHEPDQNLEQVLERAVRIVASRVGTEATVRRRDATGFTVDVPPDLVPQLAALRSRIETVGKLEMRIVANSDFVDGPVRFDMPGEKARLERWLELESNKKLVLEDPRNIRRFNEDQAQGPLQFGNLAWYPRKLRPDRAQQGRWEDSWAQYRSVQQATVKVYDDTQWNGGFVPAAVERRPAHEQFLIELVALNLKEVHFTGDDLDPDRLRVDVGLRGFGVNFGIQVWKITAYSDWSAKHIGKSCAIVLDGLVVCAPVFASRIPGRGQINDSFTRQEAEDLEAVLKSGALPAAPRFVTEEPLPASAFRRATAK